MTSLRRSLPPFSRRPAPTDIRLATASQGGAIERAEFLRSFERELQRQHLTPVQIEILLNLRSVRGGVPDIHDRYAIVDDVLWHCGATIGGLHHSINAMSYGWSARDTRAIEFFQRLWKLMKDDNDRYR